VTVSEIAEAPVLGAGAVSIGESTAAGVAADDPADDQRHGL